MMNLGKERHRAGNRGASLLLAAAALCLFWPVACMTPERAVRETDETGTRLATAFWQEQTGTTNTFDVTRPADALTLRVAMLAAARGDRRVVFPKIPYAPGAVAAATNGVLRLSLRDALAVAARNDRSYQTYKETVFKQALALDYQQYQFDTTFSGMILQALDGDMATKTSKQSGSVGAKRKLPDGTTVAGNLALDVVSLLRDDWRSAAINGDLSVTVPLMRGAGRDIVMEPLTQAERNLVYAIRDFEHYRQTYAVTVASAYYTVLKNEQLQQNSIENRSRLALNSQRADMMFEAGRMNRIEMDQAKTDLLSAEESVISARKAYESYMDSFKMTIGLPPEGKIELVREDLQSLEKEMEAKCARTGDPFDGFPSEEDGCRIALAERHDVFVTRCELEDVARNVKIAADDLLPDVTVSGGPSFNRKRTTSVKSFKGDETWDAQAKLDFPWNRRSERNAFKRQLIALDAAKRTLESKEDTVKQTVRDDYRSLSAARASYENAVRAMKVAEQRVKSNNLFLLSGRSSMRDILEAESSLLSARNSLCSAVITWWLSDLELRRDMGVLKITDAGDWVLPNG
jgi:outer membrane protein TolC